MPTFHKQGESVECNSAEILSRKFVPGSAVKLDGINFYVRYECDRNSSAEILKEVNPKKAKFNLKSNLNCGDKISADAITFYYQGLKKISIALGGNARTGTHTGQIIITKTFTYAIIKIPYSHIINAQNSKNKISKSQSE